MKYKYFVISAFFALLLAIINFSPFFSELWNVAIYKNITFGILLWVFSPLVLSFFVFYALNKDDNPKKGETNE